EFGRIMGKATISLRQSSKKNRHINSQKIFSICFALKAVQNRATILTLSMVFLSVIMDFVLGLTMLHYYSDSCGVYCWRSSHYPCLQVYVSLNSLGRVIRLYDHERRVRNECCRYKKNAIKTTQPRTQLVQNISEHLRSQHTINPTDQMDSAILTQVYDQVILTLHLSILSKRIRHIKG
uniref:Uncharacterized protein n=1 Tax=Mola mola TaxID=94237 RepID=A0A3Q4AUZ0_MOLML